VTADLASLAASGVLLVPEGAPEPVAFAAAELGAYLGRMFGRSPARRSARGPGTSWLCLAPAAAAVAERALATPTGAESVVRLADRAAVVSGASPRALLAGVYALLEAAGCRWSPRGASGEHVPGPDEALRRVRPLEVRPAFARRAFAADLATWHYSVPERLAARLPSDVAFIDWMAKRGATGLLFIRHANDTQWLIPELVGELGRRGLDLEGGGHVLVELLPRALFGTHPEYFPCAPDGKRSDLGNVCTASAGALAVVRERAGAALAALPGATDFHLWGLDLAGGGWCACPPCSDLSPADQALATCNAVADALGPGHRVFHLAYHDTLEPPRVVRPRPRVWAEFAPRERCYAHAFDDPACTTNAPYRRALDAHLALFAGRVHVFEYYGDAILFGGCALPLAEVVQRDLDCYARAGVQGVSCLVFGQYSLWAYGVNVEAFARGAVAPAAAAAARGAHAARFGQAAEPVVRYLAALERVMAEVVTYGDVLLPPAEAERAAAVRAALAAACRQAPELRRLLAAAPAAHAAEEPLVEYTFAVLEALERWLAAADAQGREAALAALGEAVDHVRVADPALVGTWGLHDLEITHHFFAGALRARRSATELSGAG
jgi:hypothetical protein